MIRLLALIAALAAPVALAQNTVRWFATTGKVSLTSAATAATIQQPSNGGSTASIDQIVVYCSAACEVSLEANGAAATATPGTIQPLLPSQLNAVIPQTFWTASNVGSGTSQGGLIEIPAGSTVPLCLSPSCGAAGQVSIGPGLGSASNYTVRIASVTATVIIAFFGRSTI